MIPDNIASSEFSESCSFKSGPKGLSVEPYQHVSDCTLKLFIIYFYLIQSLLLQVLKPTYRPNFGDFDTNLKRKNLWNSVEVHAIYALFYSMCMSLEGIVQLKKYFSAQDQDVFEPLFIAQYLFVPANTIVKNSLSPWMMEKLGIPLVKKLPNKKQARKNKAVVFLKYSVLVELMRVVKKYGRNDGYNFGTDEKLRCIRNGDNSDQTIIDRTKNIIAINSFTSIWLLTLPEKFKEWFENRNLLANLAPEGGDVVFSLGSLHFHIIKNPIFTLLLLVSQIKN